MNTPKTLELSIVIPIYNEEGNIRLLYQKLDTTLKKLGIKYEIIFIDDKSKDNSLKILKEIENLDKNVKVIEFLKNFGQSSAWDAGIKFSKGVYILMMDGDLQNDPEDIHLLYNKIKNSNYDVISGWRINRKDSFTKKLFSLFSNKLRRSILKENIHDSGCSLKIYKKECLNNIDLYGEMHRYITSILSIKGFNIGEVKVRHNERHSGKTKYGFIRIFKGFLDLLFIIFLDKYSSRPLHLFGGIGLLNFLIGFLIGAYLSLMKFFYGISLLGRPLLILSVLLMILGVQFLFFGILAEILMRVYYNLNKSKVYQIKK